MDIEIRKRIISNGKILTIILIVLTLFAYYQLDYKRHFIYNREKTECITLWQRIGNNCYIIPGKYYGIKPPKDNYIKTVNYRNYIGLLWNTQDKYDCKISISNDYSKEGLSENIKSYSKNDSLLLEYKILDTLDYQKGKRILNVNADFYKKKYNYMYIDLNRIFGIKVYDY